MLLINFIVLVNINHLYAQPNDLRVEVIANKTVTIYSTDFIHTFKFVDDSSTNTKLWRYFGMKEISSGETFVTSGDSEGVYKTSEGVDFTGGYHGNEEFYSHTFLLDNDTIAHDTDGIFYGKILNRVMNSNMFTAQDSIGSLPIRQIECIRTQILEISKYEYKYYNKWRFIEDQVITHLYLGMYCIGSLFPKIIVGDTTFFIDNSTENFLKDEIFEGSWVYPQKWEVNLKTEYLSNPNYFRPQLLIWPTSYYNKAYFGMLSGPISVSKGEIFEVNFSANYRRIELTTAISSDTIKTIINTDSIDTLTSFVGPISREDTVITVATFSVYSDSIFTVSDSLADGEFYNSDTTFELKVIYNDTTNLELDTMKYEEGTVGMNQTNEYRKSTPTKFFLTLNPGNSILDGVNLIIPSELIGSWEITLFDALGNLIDRSSFVTVGDEAYRWNLYSKNDRKLPRGSYLLFGKFTNNSGKLKVFKRIIGIR